uniref:Galactosylgalactosylxylosylprotein 3-beta-glucuronosyltransferase n=1 Tax=Parastrongyloides trichosuri TaxID=131310 RepID=A0A0N4ZEA9_PARTI
MAKSISRKYYRKNIRFILYFLLFVGSSILLILQFTDRQLTINVEPKSEEESVILPKTLIFVITPTYKRYTRIADMTRMSNTLRHVPNIHWILIEDGEEKSELLVELLDHSKIPYTYLVYKTAAGYPRRGWYQRDMALTYLRENHKKLTVGYDHAVVFFGDDDNSYDTRLFTDYISNVKTVGIWAVGLVGGAPFESPKVENGKVVGWHVRWMPKRKFATDMAGFAFSLKSVLDHPKALFGKSCKRGGGAPEPCLLEDLGFNSSMLEPFGFNTPPGKRRQILVYHTKTNNPKKYPKYDLYGYGIELK